MQEHNVPDTGAHLYVHFHSYQNNKQYQIHKSQGL